MRAFEIAAGLALLSAGARAQIVLPGQREPAQKGGDVAPHLVCSACGERNYAYHDEGRRDDQGLVVTWCPRCKRDTSQRPSDSTGAGPGQTTGAGGKLILPSAIPSKGKARPELPPPRRSTAPAGRDPREKATGGQAAFILDELKRLRNPDDSLATRAVESLLALGPPGIAAARASLAAQEAPVLLTAARVLLRSGEAADADLLFRRVLEPLPPAAGVPLLELLAKSDPVRASPAFLVEMLGHPHSGARAVASRLLTPQADAELLPLLAAPLSSPRADTRRRALELVSRIEGAETTSLLLRFVGDPSAGVAQAAIGALASRVDPVPASATGGEAGPGSHPEAGAVPAAPDTPDAIGSRLLGQAFRDRWVLRPGACALIAIVEREDRTLQPILDLSHVEPLLAGMQSGDPFLSGACAAALAGIGFRSRDADATAWLDHEVVDRLIAAVSGHQFHNDLTLLAPPALRRLDLLAGQGFGTDGPRWVEWWMHARAGFFARRAWLTIGPDDASRIVVRCAESGASPQGFVLVGPLGDGVDPATGGAIPEERLRIDAGQARELLAALEREGILGPERLPGLRGMRGAGERTVEILFGLGSGGTRGKTFVYGPGESEAWFERTVALARALRDRGRWQRYPDPARHMTAEDLWREQASWWGEEHTGLERALRLKALVLAALPSLSGSRRDQAIAEIERLYAADGRVGGDGDQDAVGAAEPADFAPLFRALSGEPYWAESSRRLLRLAVSAARASSAVGTEGAPVPEAGVDPGVRRERELPAEQGKLLVDLLVAKLSAAPSEELARVFAGCGAGFSTMMAGDSRPRVRAAAAGALAETAAEGAAGESAPPETVTTLLRLLDDPEASVEVAAVEALGNLRAESARTELLVRARLGLPDVRAAALRAVGKLGGDLVLDALSLAVADPDPKIRTAAAFGLADLRDPAGASLLIGMLGQGEGNPEAEPARAGLLALGPGAWTELLRVVNAPTHRARRDAALLLSRQNVAAAASPLMALLSSDPRDEHVASELAVLTGMDLRAQTDPPGAWWAWWDGVVHDDALAWFLSALSRAGMAPPPRTAFEAHTTPGEAGERGPGETRDRGPGEAGERGPGEAVDRDPGEAGDHSPGEAGERGPGETRDRGPGRIGDPAGPRGTREGLLFLVEVLSRKEPHLVERARRELGSRLGRDLGTLPPKGADREAWIAGVRAAIEASGAK